MNRLSVVLALLTAFAPRLTDTQIFSRDHIQADQAIGSAGATSARLTQRNRASAALATARTNMTYRDAKPILEALRKSLWPAELRTTTSADFESSWPGWVSRHDATIRARRSMTLWALPVGRVAPRSLRAGSRISSPLSRRPARTRGHSSPTTSWRARGSIRRRPLARTEYAATSTRVSRASQSRFWT